MKKETWKTIIQVVIKRSKYYCKKQGQKMFAVNFLIMSKRPTCFLYV